MTQDNHNTTDNAFTGPLKGGSMEPAYSGALSFMRRRYSRNLANVDAVVWGIPFDQAVSNRPGARFGPQAIRRASTIFEGDPQHPFGIDPFEELAVIDYGDAYIDFGRPMETAAAIASQARTIVDADAHLFSLGGDHFVTYPLLQVHAERHGPLSLVQFDAHQDTWEPRNGAISHGSFVAQAVADGIIDAQSSIQIGIRTEAPDDCDIEIIFADEIDEIGAKGIAERIKERVGANKTYFTFDIDCLDPAFAPGTGTPVAGGFSSREALSILRALGDIDFVGGDVVEVAPAYDHADITAVAASTVAMFYLALLAERRRG